MTTYAVPERRAPIRADRAKEDGDVLVPIRGALLASAVVVAFAAAALAVIGFTGSYRSVRDLAMGWGWGWFSYVFPIGIDVGIIGLIAADLWLCAIRTPAPILRAFAWTLTVATVTFNAASGWPTQGPAGWGDLIEAGAHATMPGLVVVITEAMRRAIARRARIADGRAFEALGMARWFLAPFATFGVWRRMRLWDVYTRAEAIALERDRLTLRDELREKYGRRWKRKASAKELRVMRDASRGLPIPAHLTAYAAHAEVPANVTANTAIGNSDHLASANGSANGITIEGVRGPASLPAEPGPAANANANGGYVDMVTPRMPDDSHHERSPHGAREFADLHRVELGERHRERSAVPAAAQPRTLVTSTVPHQQAPTANGLQADREPFAAGAGAYVEDGIANAAVRDASLLARTGSADGNGGTAGFANVREQPIDRFAAARADRARLAADFLQAQETERPAPTQAQFARRAGVSASTLTKALQEWRSQEEVA
ncbi:DUF2637 domain-containing protein [Actinacidiphila glaucinigra]|uniref:DUF2637 domain-containing protein n=1 Tax=Actinacidiphila glaucinigra TaxID=235986 RepID=UPI00369660CC